MSNLRVDDSARLVGSFRLGDNVYIAQGSVLRSTDNSLKIGNNTWVLENSVIIGTSEHPVRVGSKTVFGHKCIAIGAQIGDLCEIGNGTIFLPGSNIGNMCIFGEGTIVPAGTMIPDESVVVGRPGRVIRKLTDKDKNMIARMRGNDIGLRLVEEVSLVFGPMGGKQMGKLYNYGDRYPIIDDSAVIFDSAEITGNVKIGSNSIIASGVRIIGNSHGPVKIGSNVQILENTVLHLLPDNELIIEDNVTIGPGCVIHGTTIGPNSIIESGSIVCDYSVLGTNTLVKSGSVVKQRSTILDNQIVEGFPADFVGENVDMMERPSWAYKQING
ncbi:DapH/DapD/GlmU-related protein [Sporomusa malonica]|uniref:Carbonic anhydrase or acetyltransferase, isoleucine patch superfamily n=1 Tax=Sporomusa malonica TaxID=112901 RepID=A0A1W2EKZ1_9FIRM|nr:DapH/DapD/GlmU-related protein [Sporomusa malonica]SMD10411.1 Carbonic anhydrase or acetyltransferase, isoleucine patch superfamily [Sporomusa malonica]